MPDIEFLDGGSGGAAADDELAPPPPRRPLPRWVVAAGLAVLAAGIAVAVARNGGDESQPPSPTPSPSSSNAAPTPVPRPLLRTVGPDPRGFEHDLELGTSTEPVLAVAAAGDGTWILRGSVISLVTSHVTLTTALPAAGGQIVDARLAVDAPADLVWTVVRTATATRVSAYRANTLAPVRTMSVRGIVRGAAATGGRLYLSVGDQVFTRSVSGFSAQVRPQRDVQLGQVVADPVRHRVLVVSAPSAGASSIWAVSPDGMVVGHRRTRTVRATLAVSGSGAIWQAGQDAGDGALTMLDPRTLAKSASGRLLYVNLEPTATLVAGGSGVVWVRDSSGRSLQCIDARTGNQLQSWQVAGTVASVRGDAVLAFGTRAVRLDLGRCTG